MAEEAAKLPQELAELGVEDATVVRLEPGDIIVLSTTLRLTEQDFEDLRDRVRQFFGEYEVAVLEGGVRMQVVRKGGEPQ